MLLPAEGAFLVTLSAAPSHVTVITALYAVLLAYLVVQLVSITQEQILVLIVSLVPILMLVIYAKPVLLAVPPVLQLFAPAAPCHSYLPSRQDHASATASPCSTTTPPLSPAIHAPASSRVARAARLWPTSLLVRGAQWAASSQATPALLAPPLALHAHLPPSAALAWPLILSSATAVSAITPTKSSIIHSPLSARLVL